MGNGLGRERAVGRKPSRGGRAHGENAVAHHAGLRDSKHLFAPAALENGVEKTLVFPAQLEDGAKILRLQRTQLAVADESFLALAGVIGL